MPVMLGLRGGEAGRDIGILAAKDRQNLAPSGISRCIGFAAATWPMSAPSGALNTGMWFAISPSSVCATIQASGAASIMARMRSGSSS